MLCFCSGAKSLQCWLIIMQAEHPSLRCWLPLKSGPHTYRQYKNTNKNTCTQRLLSPSHRDTWCTNVYADTCTQDFRNPMRTYSRTMTCSTLHLFSCIFFPCSGFPCRVGGKCSPRGQTECADGQQGVWRSRSLQNSTASLSVIQTVSTLSSNNGLPFIC